ncbi:NAD(P)/FAD-dependent oxidoreductase [Actinomadura sp. KC216]|uniref:NAD(P)/FAD-dependent oxidoreductase n=1 Tax=Actinomadura sp. KC216 TaxID=2530370 RepID=UPI001A9FCF23|nr:NAD(P)/FAD-dependent oxidoreductase [Actinomadura sp. KC216]
MVIIGGGPGGLNAALTLGRVRRKVLLADSGHPRNGPAEHMHGFLTRDGLPPSEVRRIGREEVLSYPTTEIRDVEVSTVVKNGEVFEVSFADGTREESRRLLLATGQWDQLPEVDGLRECWGRTVVHCPYCHGYEMRDRPLAVLGSDPRVVTTAVHITRFSDDIVVCTNGPADIDEENRAVLKMHGIGLNEEPVSRVESQDGQVKSLVFASGEKLERGGIFVRAPLRQQSPLAENLGCEILPDGAVKINDFYQTTVPGAFAVGDMARLESWPFPPSQVIMAAAGGAVAAVVMDQELLIVDTMARLAESS